MRTRDWFRPDVYKRQVDATWTRDNFERTLRELTELSVRDAASSSSSSSPGAIESTPGKVDLIVWPESPAPFFTNDPLFLGPVSEMARETHSWVVTGCLLYTSRGPR